MKKRSNQTGFSLVEIVIVLAILGIVFVGATAGLSAFKQVGDLTESEKKLVNIKEQLLNFAEVHYYLPCPDTNGDGLENRVDAATATVADGSAQTCAADVGTVPYLNLGIELAEVEDAWGYNIIYYINNNTVNDDDICNKQLASSYFCNEHSMSTPRFTVTDTPPLITDLNNPWNTYSVGDYSVCNKRRTTCNAARMDSNNDQRNVEVLSASVVLVAYNEDGAEALDNLGACNYTNTQSEENCDGDRFFHQYVKSTANENDYFDDQIVTITGNEIKARTLNKVLSWRSGGGFNDTFQLLEPTAEVFDLDDANQIPINNNDTPDVVLVNRDVKDGIDFEAGDDVLAVGNNIDAGNEIVDMGDGNDMAYAVGNILSNLTLGAGDDRLVLEGRLESGIEAGSGNDKLWILGSIESSASIDLGEGDDTLWFGGRVYDEEGNPLTDDIPTNLETSIEGGDGYDIIIFEEVDSLANLPSSALNRLENFELIMFSADEDGNRNYYEIP